MDKTHTQKIAGELDLAEWQVEATALLLEEGSTVPFIARYRKEKTGSVDEVHITAIRDRLNQLEELDRRRETILRSLEEQGKLTDELKERVTAAETLSTLEDIYLPYRPKRRTRATMAREKGLEALARMLLGQGDFDPEAEARRFVDPEKAVEGVEDALSGARDIIAEWINEDEETRSRIRSLFKEKGRFLSKVIPEKEEEGRKYKDYFDWMEPVATAPSHRILAMRRGEREGFLSLRVAPPEEEAISLLEALFVKNQSPASMEVKMAAHDCYKRLLSHSMETEIRVETKVRADLEAIRIFAGNLRQLLLAPPLGQKRVMGIDPGFRTGCKVVCLDSQGKLVRTETIYPLLSETRRAEAYQITKGLCEKFGIQAIAVGNGTGGRETEAFLREVDLSGNIPVVMVNESGASVYSASEAAREEFPDQDVTVRGAISIGRRLMDPLAELVKIEPKAIGVGQYQHDVDQRALKRSLDDVVTSCVNAVGVDVNTASPQLLSYVSGLGPQLARNIVNFRNEKGPFPSRASLLNVPRLGAKAFEQAAGFLRIRGGDHPLDASAVHPESYPVVEAMARDLGRSINDLMQDRALREKIRIETYVTEAIGIPTLKDILEELDKPGRDPREEFEGFDFAEGINKIEDLRPGMKLRGVVTNVTAFGAFVDIGVHQDGLVHVSELSNRFVRDPNEVVKVHDRVLVTILNVEHDRGRVSLSMRDRGEEGDASLEAKGKGRKRSSRMDPRRVKRPFNNPFAGAFSRKG